MAAQCIIWEYQQQLRSDATSRHDNGSVAENTFFRIVQGRPAEQVYYWILEQIAPIPITILLLPVLLRKAPRLHELKWDSNAKVYTLTLTDANNLNIDLEALTAKRDLRDPQRQQLHLYQQGNAGIPGGAPIPQKCAYR